MVEEEEDKNQKLIKQMDNIEKYLGPFTIIGVGIFLLICLPISWILVSDFDLRAIPLTVGASVYLITTGIWMYWTSNEKGIYLEYEITTIDEESYGPLIDQQKTTSYLQEKKGSLMISVYMFGIFTLFVLMWISLPIISLTEFQTQLVLILLTILILIFMYFIFAGLFEYHTMTQVKVFQNGFIPNKRPWKHKKNNEVYFINWAEVDEVKDYVSSHSDEFWKVIFKVPGKGKFSLTQADTSHSKKLREFLTNLIEEKYPNTEQEERFWM